MPLNIKNHIFTVLLLMSLSANSANIELKPDFFSEKSLDFVSNTTSQQTLYLQHVKNNYQKILQLIKKNKRVQAAQQLEALIKQDPEQSAYYLLKALLALLDKHREEAKQHFLKAIKLNPKNTQALAGLARIALENKQYNKAKHYAEQILKQENNIISAYKILADIALQQQGTEAAERVLLEAKNHVKDNLHTTSQILKLLGKLYISTHKPEKFLQQANFLAKQYPDNIDSLSLLAEAQISSNQFAQAEKSLRKILAKTPESGQYHFLLAQVLNKQAKNERDILLHLNQAASLLDNPNLALTYKIAFLIQHKHLDQALSIAQDIDKKFPSDSLGKMLLGDIYLAQKDYPQALQYYRQAYKISPDIAILDTILRILAMQHKSDEMIAFLNDALTKDENNDPIRLRLAITYHKNGHLDQAINHYQHMLKKHPDNVILLNNLALAYNKTGHSEALQLAKKAHEKVPQAGDIADTYGTILLKQGQIQKSLKILKQATKLAPKLTEIQLHLAEAYYANNYPQQAKQILHSLINNHSPEEKIAKKYLNEWK